MLRETEDAADSDVTILLNGVARDVAGEPTATNFELAVQAAGSIADHALRTGRAVTLLVPEDDWRPVVLAPGATGRVRLLETLAATDPDGLSRLGPRVRELAGDGRHLRRGRLLALVVLALDVELARELIALRACGLRVAVVHVPATAFRRLSSRREISGSLTEIIGRPGDLSPSAATENLGRMLQAAGVTYRALGPGDDLRAVLALPTGTRRRTPASPAPPRRVGAL